MGDFGKINNITVFFSFIPNNCVLVACGIDPHKESAIDVHGCSWQRPIVLVVQERFDCVQATQCCIVQRCIATKKPQLIQRQTMMHCDREGA